MTSIAYPVKPPLPGWMWTAGALLTGWIVAGLALYAGMLFWGHRVLIGVPLVAS